MSTCDLLISVVVCETVRKTESVEEPMDCPEQKVSQKLRIHQSKSKPAKAQQNPIYFFRPCTSLICPHFAIVPCSRCCILQHKVW